MYLDFSAKDLSSQWSSKEIMFLNVHPRSVGDEPRRLSGPTELIILVSLLSIQHILFEKQHRKTPEKNQNQLEVPVGSAEMTFPLLSLSYESFSVSCFFIRLLLTKRDATFSILTNTVSILAIGKFIRWSFHFSAFPE